MMSFTSRSDRQARPALAMIETRESAAGIAVHPEDGPIRVGAIVPWNVTRRSSVFIPPVSPKNDIRSAQAASSFSLR